MNFKVAFRRFLFIKTSMDKKNQPGGKFLFAFCVLNKSIWSGNNNKKSHPSMRRLFESGIEKSCSHAELACLVKVPRQCRSKVKIYVVRVKCDGKLSMAKPCSMCVKFLKNNNINPKNIFYTNWDGIWSSLDKR